MLLAACTSPPAATPGASASPTQALPPTFSSPANQAPAQRQEIQMPAAVEETAAAAAQGNLYVMGGFNAGGASLDSVYVFDGTSWRTGPRLPLPVDHPSASALYGQVYLAGGHSNGRDSARVFRLDGDHWTELAALHFARGGHALIAAQGKLFAIGGNTSRGNVAQAEAYDPATNGWTVLPSLPDPRNHVMGFVAGGEACVAGGR
ncbi:MAG: hypothetical protein E6H86_14760, partial [Chloroflexi bacterium]